MTATPKVVVRHLEWDDLLTQLAEDQVDLVVSSMTKTKQRERQYNVIFSDGYFSTHQRFVVRAGQTGCLKDRVVGVVGGNPPTTNQRAAELLSAKFGYQPALKKRRHRIIAPPSGGMSVMGHSLHFGSVSRSGLPPTATEWRYALIIPL
jgi:hypothetical protein